MQSRTPAGLDQRDPTAVGATQFLLGPNPLVQTGQRLLVLREMMQG